MIVFPDVLNVTGIGVVGVTRLNDGVPRMPTFHVPLCETAGTPRMPTFQEPACITPGVLLTFTLGMPLIVTLPETGSGEGARTGTGLASVFTTVTGADGGVCGSAWANGASTANSDAKASGSTNDISTFPSPVFVTITLVRRVVMLIPSHVVRHKGHSSP